MTDVTFDIDYTVVGHFDSLLPILVQITFPTCGRFARPQETSPPALRQTQLKHPKTLKRPVKIEQLVETVFDTLPEIFYSRRSDQED